MRNKETFIAAALIAGAIALGAWTSTAQSAVSVTAVSSVASSAGFATAGTAAGTSAVQADPNAAHGAGFLSWWHSHGKQVAEVAACALDGAGIGRMLALGMTAGGGAWAAAGLAVAALACLA